MDGRARLLLGAVAVAALVGFALWRQVPATRVAVPTEQSPKAAAVQSPASAGMLGDGTGAQAARGRPAAADRVRAFEELKQRAKAGDAVAQRKLAEAYDACFMVNLDREGFIKGLDLNRRMMREPARPAVLEQALHDRVAQCDAVDGGAIVPVDLIRGWYAQAAENGDLPSRLMDNAFKQKSPDPAESARLFEEVLASNDPAAVFAMGGTLGTNYSVTPDDPTAALTTGEQASWAWMVAACRMGYDCGPSSTLMGTLCLVQNGCTGEDFEAYLKRDLRSNAERRDLERRVTEILRLVEGQ
ncbi:hypothetical protein [Stenotrophomonas sp.]|uniref:hypothetical protein n=1 Tax=Stenotrophomonas sp. TaxID=69392 RepID=UPI0028A7D171|nr:hypothetical protein [Stenotrophomonas sp.]